MPKTTIQAGGAGKEKEARTIMLRAVNKIYDAVRITLGPDGLNGLVYGTYGRAGRITNDGVTVGGAIELSDELETMAGKSYFEGSKRTNERVGDGTTSTAVIAGKLINSVLKDIDDAPIEIKSRTSGSSQSKSPRRLRNEIMSECEKVVEQIKAQAVAVETLEDLEKISIVSIGDEKLGKLVAKIVWETGKNGVVDVIEGNKTEIETEINKGMRFAAKIPAKAFITDSDKLKMIVEDVPVIVTNHAIDNAHDIAAITPAFESSKLVIFAEDFSDDVLVSLVLAKKNGFMIYPIKCRSLTTEEFEDLACYTQARFVNKNTGGKINSILPIDLGSAERIVVSESEREAVVLGGKGDTSERVKAIQAQLEDTKLESLKNKLKHRLASLVSAVGVIKVGAPTEAQMVFLKHKLEDGQYAARAALQEGYVRGGGLCLKAIADALPEDHILKEALLSPYAQIQENSGGAFEIADDVFDPAKVVRLSVEHALDLASSFITIGFLCAEKREHESYEGEMKIAEAIMIGNRVEARRHSLTIREDGTVKGLAPNGNDGQSID